MLDSFTKITSGDVHKQLQLTAAITNNKVFDTKEESLQTYSSYINEGIWALMVDGHHWPAAKQQSSSARLSWRAPGLTP